MPEGHRQRARHDHLGAGQAAVTQLGAGGVDRDHVQAGGQVAAGQLGEVIGQVGVRRPRFGEVVQRATGVGGGQEPEAVKGAGVAVEQPVVGHLGDEAVVGEHGGGGGLVVAAAQAGDRGQQFEQGRPQRPLRVGVRPGRAQRVRSSGPPARSTAIAQNAGTRCSITVANAISS